MTTKNTEQDILALAKLFKTSDWDELHIKRDDFELFLSKTGGDAVQEESREAAKADRAAERVAVKAPHLATFQAGPEPDAGPCVSVGDRVTPESEICLLQVRNKATPLKAGIAGVISEIAVKGGDLVEYDQPLVWIEPE